MKQEAAKGNLGALALQGEEHVRNPFDDAAAEFQVLVNHASQYSLWPALRDAPPEWSLVLLRTSRQRCLDWISAQCKEHALDSQRETVNGSLPYALQ
jgi:uncharacterized protein YbdZ (MbtH family)